MGIGMQDLMSLCEEQLVAVVGGLCDKNCAFDPCINDREAARRAYGAYYGLPGYTADAQAEAHKRFGFKNPPKDPGFHFGD